MAIFAFIAICLNCFCAVNAREPKQGVAASVSLVDVRAAIDAARPGDTVIVPAGRATWTEQLIIRKGISLIGAGIGKTVITVGWMTTGWNQGLILYRPDNPGLNEPFRLSGFEINGNGNGSYKNPESLDYSQILVIWNSGQEYLTNMRLDHNKFYNCGKPNWITISGHIAGVADNNIIGDAAQDAHIASRICHIGRNNNTWLYETFQYGSAIQFYWEDNTIIAYNFVALGYYGAKYAFRHNIINWIRDSEFVPLFDAHGNKPGNMTSIMGLEIYENEIVCTYNRGGSLLDHRGGMALIYNNRTSRTPIPDIQVREEFLDDMSPPAKSPDGQNQHVDKSYFWSNENANGHHGGVGVRSTIDYGGEKGLVPREDREFWQQVDSFDGTHGMGVGPIAARTGFCSLEGAGYWATDDQKLYRWHNGGWELYYTPYAYPHPLRSASSE